MKRLKLTERTVNECIQAAVAVLQSGGIVVYPTETVYGVGCDAQNTEAVTKLLHYKQRPVGKPISVLVANANEAETYVEMNEQARTIFATFLPGPVTVVCRDKGLVDSRLASEWNTLGIRVSSHPFAYALAVAFGKPLTSTSANASGAARPYTIDGLLSHLSSRQQEEIDLIIDADTLPKREPSTVIDTTTDTQTIVRAGESLEALVPPFISKSEVETQAFAAELLRQHHHVLGEKALIFALEGDMGMGKTQFAKGIGMGLEIAQVITSPTYVLMKEYVSPQKVKFTHLDLWRLQQVNPEELALEPYLTPGNVLVIEWATPLLPYLKTKSDDVVVHRITIEGTDERMIKFLPL